MSPLKITLRARLLTWLIRLGLIALVMGGLGGLALLIPIEQSFSSEGGWVMPDAPCWQYEPEIRPTPCAGAPSCDRQVWLDISGRVQAPQPLPIGARVDYNLKQWRVFGLLLWSEVSFNLRNSAWCP